MTDRSIHSVHFHDLTDQEWQHLLDVANDYPSVNTKTAFWSGVRDNIENIEGPYAPAQWTDVADIDAYENGYQCGVQYIKQRLERHKLPQHTILSMLQLNTHGLWAPNFVDNVNDAFGVHLKVKTYEAIKNPDLHIFSDDGKAKGLSSKEVAIGLCDQLNLRYTRFQGTGYIVRACITALQQAGYGKDDPTS